MTNKTLAAMGLAALIMVVLTVFATLDRAGRDDVFERGRYLVPGLDPDRVYRISVERGDAAIELERSGDRFLIRTKGGYPALSERVSNIFMVVAGIRCDEFVTDNPDNHGVLGVDLDTASAVIRFHDRDGRDIVGVVVGETRRDEKGLRHYVRLERDDRVYLAERFVPFISAHHGRYIREAIFDGTAGDYHALSFSGPGGRFTAKRDDGRFVPEGLPEAEAASLEPAISPFIDAVLGLRIADIPAESDVPDLSFDTVLGLSKDDKTTYRLTLGCDGGRCFARVEAGSEQPVGRITIARDEPEESLREKEAILLAADRAEEFNEQHRGWVYEVDGDDASRFKGSPEQILRRWLDDAAEDDRPHAYP